MSEYPEELERAEEVLSEEDDYSETPPSDIVAFNEQRSCADLARLHKTKQLVIKPDFQRDIVWSNSAQTRFIDSLVKQLPIPSMCLSFDYKTDERLMIDGLQRIATIIKFLTDKKWKLSNLEDIDSRISGKSSEYIETKYPDIYGRVENLMIPITVLRCDYSKKAHSDYLFTIFHRLNTGGNKLSNQEIRNCIYSGKFNDMLKKVVLNETVRSLFGLEDDKSYRYAYEELILRVLALVDNHDSYNGKLAKFLSDYMEKNRDSSEADITIKERNIIRTIKLVHEKIMRGKKFPKISKATTEAIFYGIYKNIDRLEDVSAEVLLGKYEALRKNENFSVISLSEGLASAEKVKARLAASDLIFGANGN